VKAILCSALFAIASVSLAIAQGTYTQIDVPGAIGTFVSGINSAGDIVGRYEENPTLPQIHGFLLSNGALTTLIYPGANAYSAAAGINDLGQIVGTYFDDSGETFSGFVYDVPTNTFTGTFSDPLYGYTFASGINNAGTIVGNIQLYGGPTISYVAFQLTGTTFKKISPQGSSSTTASSIDNFGDVIGLATFNRVFGFISANGKYQRITLPILLAQPYGINDFGALVGLFYSTKDNVFLGFIYQNSIFQILNFPGSTGTFPMAINNSGEVVGYFYDSNSSTHGFTWTPPADGLGNDHAH